jgi:hypothetical protein
MDEEMKKWTAPTVVVKDGSQMLVPMQEYIDAVGEIQALKGRLKRGGHLVNALVKHLETRSAKDMGLLAALKASNSLNRTRAG